MTIKSLKISIYNMTCSSCEKRITKLLSKLKGVKSVHVSYENNEAVIEYDSNIINIEQITEAINNSEYTTVKKNNINIIFMALIAATIIFIGSSNTGIDMTEKLKNASYFVIFIVGILTSIHCAGMCGGIMLSQSIGESSTSKFAFLKPSLMYNFGRILSYTIIGGIVGSIGSVISISSGAKASIQIFAGIFMILLGLKMSGFSLLKKLKLNLNFSSCFISKKFKSPFVIGMLNGLMPCGPLQTMQLYALGTGSAIGGALSMFVFSLGTVPIMLAFGSITGFLGKNSTKTLLKSCGIFVVILGLLMGSRGLALSGYTSPLPPKAQVATSELTSTDAAKNNAPVKDGVQVIKMTVDSNGYTPENFILKKNMPTKLIIDAKALNSCNQTIVFPSLNIEKTLNQGENIIEFTPTNEDIAFSCWMGMISGNISVEK